MFMAGAPFGADNLDYEHEEAGIPAATQRLPMQLRVEESGCLEFLGTDRSRLGSRRCTCPATAQSRTTCRNSLLEDPGERDEVPAPELMIALGDNKPPLVFLSACRTAEQPAAALPLALSLVRRASPTCSDGTARFTTRMLPSSRMYFMASSPACARSAMPPRSPARRSCAP